MLQQYKKQTNIGVGIGFLLSVAGRVLEKQQPSLGILSLGLLVLSAGLVVWGCSGYAKGKGYSGYWGALGVFSLIGFIILALFPDRNNKNSLHAQVEN